MKTFAEKLKEHTAYCNELFRQIRELTFEVATKKSEVKRLDKEAEKIFKLLDATMEKFEIEYGKELKSLELYLENNE